MNVDFCEVNAPYIHQVLLTIIFLLPPRYTTLIYFYSYFLMAKEKWFCLSNGQPTAFVHEK